MVMMSYHQGSWWSLLIKGIVAIVVGILALSWPGSMMGLAVSLLGVFVLIVGIVATVGALMHRKESDKWIVMLVPGLLGIIIGVVALGAPAVVAAILIYLIALWALIHGISEIYGALKFREEVKGEWVPLIVGITSVILGILLLIKPMTAGAVFTWLIGLFLLILGAFWLLLAYRAWSWRQTEVQTEVRSE
jgi:uncharacterized membrane protein HdeD (DUF308 family)